MSRNFRNFVISTVVIVEGSGLQKYAEILNFGNLTSKDYIFPGLTDAENPLEHLFPRRDDASMILIAVPPAEYSCSAIARAVEDADAHLLNLNVTADTLPGGLAPVLLRVSHSNPTTVIRSLERYGFEVIDSAASRPGDDDLARERALEALRYLSV